MLLAQSCITVRSLLHNHLDAVVVVACRTSWVVEAAGNYLAVVVEGNCLVGREVGIHPHRRWADTGQVGKVVDYQQTGAYWAVEAAHDHCCHCRSSSTVPRTEVDVEVRRSPWMGQVLGDQSCCCSRLEMTHSRQMVVVAAVGHMDRILMAHRSCPGYLD